MLGKDKEKYMDIIDMPRHVSNKHPQMSIHDRAAQFASFAALTGHDEKVLESAEEVFQKMEYGDDENGYFEFEESI